MTELAAQYHLRPAAAWTRATLGPGPGVAADAVADDEADAVADVEAYAVADDEADAADVRRALAAGCRLHRFKRTMGLPRVTRALGALRGLAPTELLDVGGGRGVFLWPLLEAFPRLRVVAVDRAPRVVERLAAVQRGGLRELAPCLMDATALAFAPRAFDVVTVLEVLEHVPEVWRAAAAIVRVARRALVVSVPSRPDDNTEHLRLFTAATLRELLGDAGARAVRCDHVLNHIIAVARVGDDHDGERTR